MWHHFVFVFLNIFLLYSNVLGGPETLCDNIKILSWHVTDSCLEFEKFLKIRQGEDCDFYWAENLLQENNERIPASYSNICSSNSQRYSGSVEVSSYYQILDIIRPCPWRGQVLGCANIDCFHQTETGDRIELKY